jgi:sugar phosphate isomerase/epimerase
MNRRDFIGSSVAALAAASALGGRLDGASLTLAGGQPPATPATPTKTGRDTSGQTKLGWELGTQAWTFRDRTCFEAIETAQRLGLTCIELYPGQKMSPAAKDVTIGVGMTAAQISELKEKLKSCGVRANSFGVVNPGRDEKAYRDIFAFAKSLDMRGITCEPPLTDPKAEPTQLDAWKLLDRLTRETGIYAACHNHPKPNTYWNPDVVLGAIKGIDNKLVGACADTGHWVRSGLVPADCLKKYEGRVLELHFKDVKNDVDQPWGTGGGDARAQLVELKRQGFKGCLFAEYETGSGKELEANVAKCIEWFDRTAAQLA